MPDGSHDRRRLATPGYLGINRRPTRREWLRALVLFLVGMVGLTLMFLFIHPRASLLAVGSSAPRVTLSAAGGEQVDVTAAAAGRPYVLDFFEAGCSHCQQVAAQVCDENLPVFAVDAAKDSPQMIVQFQRQFAPRCGKPMLVDPALHATSAYAVSAVPTVYVVKGGKIAFAGAGPEGVAALHGAVQKALGG
ncbi:MAG: TlpA family protein disulfide reductase [Candidatus Dormibacteraeota bacterium]|uniref:TlpA family protein disulfide reductase n=1 Tax=Candidatus Amunia macphersoniae TaxID=3127014 RepID=A0A934KGS6_9BACT|nr:TlpA family protein disulfide reductase [Candidatus Dormibacteraeota bacterium]